MIESAPDIDFGEMRKDIISEKIANRLLTLIREKRLKPGDRLPPERELAVQMNVSRPSLREALKALQMMRIIENRHGSGNYVSSLEPELLVEHLNIVFALNDSTYHDLFQARRILETSIAGLAAENITDGEVGELEASLADAERKLGDPEGFMEADLELHHQILIISRNRILPVFMRSINKIGLLSRRKTGESQALRKQTIKDHHAIVRALKDRDPAAARQAMNDHLSHVEHQISDSSGD